MNRYYLETQPIVLTDPDFRKIRITINNVQQVFDYVLDNGRYLFFKLLPPGIYPYEIFTLIPAVTYETGTIYVFADTCCTSNLDEIRQRDFRVYPGFETTTIKMFFENSGVPYDPVQVLYVEIRTLADMVLQTLTPIRIGVGIYRIDFQIVPGTYKDVWFYQDISTGPILNVEMQFTVLSKDISTACRFISPWLNPKWGQGGVWASLSSEIDLREEIKEILHGSEISPPHGRLFVLRRMERDTDGHMIHCVCYKVVNGSGDKNCIYCKGEYFRFSEEIILGYLSWNTNPVGNLGVIIEHNTFKSGIFDYNKPKFYCEFFVNPKTGDKLYIIAIDDFTGNIQLPVVRQKKFQITSIYSHFSDMGRIEFFAVQLEEETK